MEEKLSLNGSRSNLSSLTLNEDDDDETEKSDPLLSDFPTWASRIKCFQAYVSITMSFSTVLQFSKSVGDFGLVLIIPYGFFRIFIGVPAVLIELMLGRYIMGNVAKAWTMSPIAKGVLYASLGITAFAIICNNISLPYLLKYLVSLFHGTIPWEKCHKEWADINCYDNDSNTTAFLTCLQSHSTKFCQSLDWESSGVQFWKNFADNTKSISSVTFSILYLGISVVLTLIINYKGIRSCEKFFVLLVYGPLILASILAFATFLIPGVAEGLKRICFLDFSLLLSKEIWLTAFEDTLVFLSVCTLSLIFVSTHGKFLDDILLDLLMVVFSDLICCILITTPVLSIIASDKPSENDSTPKQPLFRDKLDAFISMSEALLAYPYPNVLWTMVFYLELILISLGSQSILFLTAGEAVMGIIPKFSNFFHVSWVLGFISIVLTLPFLCIPYYFSYSSGTFIITVLFLSALSLEIFYGFRKFKDDFHFMMGYSPPLFLKCTWATIAVQTIVVLILKMYYKIPKEPFPYMVYIYVSLPVLVFIVSASVEIYFAHVQGKVTAVFTASPEWGPENSLLRKSRIIFNSKAVTKEFMYRQELKKKPLIKPVDFSEQNVVQLI